MLPRRERGVRLARRPAPAARCARAPPCGRDAKIGRHHDVAAADASEHVPEPRQIVGTSNEASDADAQRLQRRETIRVCRQDDDPGIRGSLHEPWSGPDRPASAFSSRSSTTSGRWARRLRRRVERSTESTVRSPPAQVACSAASRTKREDRRTGRDRDQRVDRGRSRSRSRMHGAHAQAPTGHLELTRSPGVADRLDLRMHAEFGEQVLHMALHREDADRQRAGDLVRWCARRRAGRGPPARGA